MKKGFQRLEFSKRPTRTISAMPCKWLAFSLWIDLELEAVGQVTLRRDDQDRRAVGEEGVRAIHAPTEPRSVWERSSAPRKAASRDPDP